MTKNKYKFRRSEKNKKQISRTVKKLWKDKKIIGFTGKTVSEDTRKKISDGCKNLWKNPEYKKKVSKKIQQSLLNISSKKRKEINRRHNESLKEHNNICLKLKQKYQKEGYRVMTTVERVPDLILIKKGKVIGIEVERRSKNIPNKQRQYSQLNFFDSLEFYWETLPDSDKQLFN